MKKSLLLAALLFSSFHILGQSESVLTVFSEFGEKFTLILNGEVMNDEPNNRVTSTGLTQSFYMAAVKFEDESMGVLRQKNLRTKDFDENPVHITYVLTVNRKGEMKLKYYNEEPVEDYMIDPEVEAEAPMEVIVEVEEEIEEQPVKEEVIINMSTSVKEEKSSADEENTGSVKLSIDVDGLELDVKVEESNVVVKEEVKTEVVVIDSETELKTEHVVVEEVVEYNGCAGNTLNPSDFDRLSQSIASKSFADSKMTILKQGLNDRCVSAEQVRDLMRLFDFEEDRLEIAKYAYDLCYDQENYFQVNDAFDFELTIDELNEYIQKQ